MTPSEWEVVTKSKKQKNLTEKKEAHTEKKRLAAVQPKLEEILSAQQYQNVIAGPIMTKEQSPAKITNSTKTKSPKKSLKAFSQDAKQPQKTKVPQKPKSLEVALKSISPQDFTKQLEELKLFFPGSELLWLKGIATFLSSSLPYDCDPVFSGKAIDYPSNLATPELKALVVNFLESVGEANLDYFYHALLTSMVVDLSRNLPIVGYKFLLQLIGQNWPKIGSNNMAKTALLLNSYQNRSNFGLSIFWAIGQCGYNRLDEGIRVWRNLMLPNLEMRSYSKFVVEYIEKILKYSLEQKLNLNYEEFTFTFNALRATYPGIQRDLQKSLIRSAILFLNIYLINAVKHAYDIFELVFLKIISDIDLEVCTQCLINNAESFEVWKLNYKRQLSTSYLLLQHIDNELELSALPLISSKPFANFLSDMQVLNNELNKEKRKDYVVDDIVALIDNIQERSGQLKKRQDADQQSSSKRCSGCCKWVLGSLFLIVVIGGVLCYDTQVNGKGVFARSATGKVLKDAGLLPYVERAWYTTMGTSARGFKWAEQHVPPYAKPVLQLTSDLFKLGRNAACNVFSALHEFIGAKLPVVAEFLDQYVPGLPKKIENGSVAVKDTVVDVYVKSLAFFRTQIFVGRLSPENLQQALNQTQNLALEYFNIFHKKVDAYAKLK